VSFTIAIFTFSVGKSASDTQTNKQHKYNPEYNKVINFSEIKELSVDKLIEDLKGQNVSIYMVKNQDKSNIKIKTYLKTDGIFIEETMKDGNAFNKDDFNSKENKVISTTTVEEEDLTLQYFDKEERLQQFKLNKVGESSDRDEYIIMPYQLFEEIYGTINLNDSSLTFVVSGYGYEIELFTKRMEEITQNLPSKGYISLKDYNIYNTSKEARMAGSILVLIIGVTIINSIGISSIWVESRKKEIIMRKIMGATDFRISLLFFGELSIICTISIVLALTFQMILNKLTGGYIMNMELNMNISNVIYSIILTVGLAFSVAIPFIKGLKEIQPIEIIREE
ncbi:MAG: ABC transporter permease, partial [Clostridium sp.]